MNDDRAKTPRTLLLADHLWEAIADMATEMGSDRDALINQALFTFARLNGYLIPSDLKRMSSVHPPPERRAAGVDSPPPPPAGQVSPEEERTVRPPADAGRVAELAQQLAPEATSMEAPGLGEQGLLPRKAAPAILPSRTRPEPPEPPAAEPSPGPVGGPTLVLLADGRELDRVAKERFLIGRGKHCDLIINSGKVSREHAAITRQGSDYFIEDLGSSNGTWHDKRRITRRQIQEGDEYFICAEKLGCTFR